MATYQRTIPGGPVMTDTQANQRLIPGYQLVSAANAPAPAPSVGADAYWLIAARRAGKR